MRYKGAALATKETTTPTAALREALLRDRLRLHAAVAPHSTLGAVLAASVFLVLVGQPLALGGAGLAWILALAVALGARLGLAGAWRKHRHADGAWLLAHRAAYFLHGLVWAAAAWTWLPPAGMPQFVALVLVFAAVGASGLVGAAFDLVAGIVFAGTALSPVLWRLLIDGGPAAAPAAAAPPGLAGQAGAGGQESLAGLAVALGLLLALMLLAATRSASFVHKALRARRAVRESLQQAEGHAQALRESEAALRTFAFAVNSIAEAVSVVHRDQGYVMVNDAWCEITGVAREQVLGRRPEDVLGAPYLSQARREALAACLEEQRATRVVSQYGGADGHLRHLETVYYPYRDASTAANQAVVTTRDITRQVEDREAIAAGAEYLRRTLDATGDAIFATDALDQDEPVRFINEQMLRMWGLPTASPASSASSAPLAAATPPTLAQVVATIRAQVADREAVIAEVAEILTRKVRDERRLLLRDGRVLLRRYEPAPMGERVLRVWSFRDITAEQQALAVLRRSEAEQRAARDEAEEANRAKSQFLAHMSHELRTPLNAIVGFGQLLRHDAAMPLAPPQRAHVEEMLRGAYHLLELINEVLDLGRIEAGRLVLQPDAVPVAPLVEECFALVLPLASERGVTLLPLAEASHHGAAVLADRVRLKQVLLNLLSNAIKYNRPQGEVEVTLGAPARSGRLRIDVRDTGPGLDDAARQRLFRPFERLGAERGDAEGTGIGLALSQGLVLAMGGRIGVVSEPGHGSRFWVELAEAGRHEGLDADAATMAADVLDTSAPTPEPVSAATVLYIDDNAVNLTLMQAMLALLPEVRLLCTESPFEGLLLAESGRPDLVLLDIQLPGMDGFEVRKRLFAASATADVPVVAVSANAMPADIEAARRAGFAEYLTKPLDLAHLHATVRRLLAERRDASGAASPATADRARSAPPPPRL